MTHISHTSKSVSWLSLPEKAIWNFHESLWNDCRIAIPIWLFRLAFSICVERWSRNVTHSRLKQTSQKRNSRCKYSCSVFQILKGRSNSTSLPASKIFHSAGMLCVEVQGILFQERKVLLFMISEILQTFRVSFCYVVLRTLVSRLFNILSKIVLSSTKSLKLEIYLEIHVQYIIFFWLGLYMLL